MKDTSPTAYFVSISQVLEATPSGAKANGAVDIEVLAYCFAAVLSMVDRAVIQKEHAKIFNLIKQKLLSADASDYTSKYGVMALQFLLHSKTLAQWQSDSETTEATNMLLSFLLDATKKKKSQKQAIKSICTMLQNRDILKQPTLLNSIKSLVQATFFQIGGSSGSMQMDTDSGEAQLSHTAQSAR